MPFGNLEDGDSNIHWPPKGDVQMNVRGFKEAFENAIVIKIQDKPHVEIPVASPHGLVVLKLISWNDRDISIRDKDAKDFAYLLETYEHVDTIKDRLYDNPELMEKYNWEIETGSAYMLGVDSAAITQSKTKDHIQLILDKNIGNNSANHLVDEMCVRIEDEYDTKMKLALAFAEGFGS